MRTQQPPGISGCGHYRRTGGSADEIARRVRLENVRIVINEAYREGMGTSLRKGISVVDPQAEAVLVVLADQPFVRPATIDHLIQEYYSHRPQIAIPMYKGFRCNPVLLDRSVFPEIAGLTGDIGCRPIFGAHTEKILKVWSIRAGQSTNPNFRAALFTSAVLIASRHSIKTLRMRWRSSAIRRIIAGGDFRKTRSFASIKIEEVLVRQNVESFGEHKYPVNRLVVRLRRRKRRADAVLRHLNQLHHSAIFVCQDMAVEHVQSGVVEESGTHLDIPGSRPLRRGQWKRVPPNRVFPEVDGSRAFVRLENLDHLERIYVNVERMRGASFVVDGPFLDGA